jgi:hypothetical protein
MRAGRLRLMLAILVAAELLAVYLWMPRQPETRVEETPRLEGYVMVYVNGELRAVSKMHSFTKPVPAMLALALFPTSKLRNMTVEYWDLGSPTGTIALNLGGGGYVDRYTVPYKDLTTYPPTFGKQIVVPYESVWGYSAEIGRLKQIDTVGEIVLWTFPSASYLYSFANTIHYVERLHLPPPSPAFYSNETHVMMVMPVTLAFWRSEEGVPEKIWDIALMRSTGLYYTHAYVRDIRVARDVFDQAVDVYPGDVATFVYVFAFKGRQFFTENWVKAFAAWLYNGRGLEVTATDGSSVPIGPRVYEVNLTCDCWYGTTAEDAEPLHINCGYDATGFCCPTTYNGKNIICGDCGYEDIDIYDVPERTYIVLGDGQTQFSRAAYRVQREIARAEPNVTVVEGRITVSATFVFDRDVTVTEAAVYSKLRHGKEVMLLYYVFPRPVKVKSGQPFAVEFSLDIPYSGGV